MDEITHSTPVLEFTFTIERRPAGVYTGLVRSGPVLASKTGPTPLAALLGALQAVHSSAARQANEHLWFAMLGETYDEAKHEIRQAEHCLLVMEHVIPIRQLNLRSEIQCAWEQLAAETEEHRQWEI